MCYECVDFARGYVWYMNLIFNILGFVMVIGGVVAIFVSQVGEYVGRDISIGVCALGAFMILLATLAMCGSTKISHDNRCTLKVYVVFLSLLIVAQAALVVVAFFKEGHLFDFIQGRWNGFEKSDRENFMKNVGCGMYNEDKKLSCGSDLDSKACFTDCFETVKKDFGNVTSILSIVSICIIGYELLMLVFSVCIVCEDTSNQMITTDENGNQKKIITV
jgi:hypothetical protein